MATRPGDHSVRVYGRLGGEAALLTTLSRDGPTHRLPVAPAPNGVPQFVAVWRAGVRGGAPGRSASTWSVMQGDGVRVCGLDRRVPRAALMARAYSVRGEEIASAMSSLSRLDPRL